MMDYLTKHFLVLSAIITGVSATFVSMFVFSYLSVFDSSLIWLVEYPDIVKFMIVGIGLSSASALLITSFGSTIHEFIFEGRSTIKWLVLIFIFILAVFTAVAIYFDTKHGDYKLYLHLTRFGSYVAILDIIYSTLLGFKHIQTLSRKWVMQHTGFFLFYFCIFGTAYGYDVKAADATLIDVQVRKLNNENETLSGMSVVLFLSHHVVLTDNKSVIVLPTADILRMTTSSKAEQKH